MEIKAVKFRTNGFYTQPFAFGGEEGMDKFDHNIHYRGSLQNYLIDTGDEVILLDTGLPAGTPVEVPDENSPAFTGQDICSYMEALAALGYRPNQVTIILLTHKHSDHSGELKSFPNAKIYVNAEELSATELQGIPNLVPVHFNDGPYYNFPESQKIQEGIYFIKAKGHTFGNSIVIVENNGLFYMMHADITYVDEALYEDKLSVVYDDLAEARATQNRVREFVRSHPTVYMGTHTPQRYENLEAKRVMDLDNPVPTVFAEVSFSEQKRPASMSAPSAATFMTRLNMTASLLRTSLTTGNVPAVRRERRSLIRRNSARHRRIRRKRGWRQVRGRILHPLFGNTSETQPDGSTHQIL